jgi:SAM-dependent methyltransferase
MTDLHALVAGFSDAEVYERGRPAHGQPVVDAVAQALELAPGAAVLDLGAGTGKLSRALIAGGFDVVAVEPLEGMRSVLTAAIGAERVLDGVAEAIPLPDRSVDAVTSADAFHWFDEARAVPEIRRVLRPGGGVAILRAAPVLDLPWAAELGELILSRRGDHPAFVARGAAAAFDEDAAFGPVAEQAIESDATPLDRAGILAWVSSFSWVGTMPEGQRGELLAQVEAMLDRHGVETVSHRVTFQIWTTRLIER